MARIRTIKPEFWGDEKLAPLTPIDRLVFLGLIGMADDAGRIVDTVRAIDGFIFPETEDSARESIDKLVELGRIDRGVTASGQRILQLINWDHQKIDKPNMAAALPPIVILDESSRRRRNLPAKLRDAILDRDGHICQECGCEVRRSKVDKYDAGADLAEIDHIVPVKDGGTNDPQNLQTLCHECNRAKAGNDVRRRNVEASEIVRRQVGDVSTPHINDLGSVSVPPTNDQRSASSEQAPLAAAADDLTRYAIGLAVAANAGIAARWGEQPNAVHFSTGTQLAHKLMTTGVPLELAKHAILACCKSSKLTKPPSVVSYFAGPVEDARADAEQRALNDADATTQRGGAPRPIALVVGGDDSKKREESERAEYDKARRASASAWANNPENTAAYVAISKQVNEQYAGFGNDNAWARKGRLSEITFACAERAGFPDFETWRAQRRGAA